MNRNIVFNFHINNTGNLATGQLGNSGNSAQPVFIGDSFEVAKLPGCQVAGRGRD